MKKSPKTKNSKVKRLKTVNLKSNSPRHLKGSLRFVDEKDDGSAPVTLKEFKKNVTYEQEAKISAAIFIPKYLKIEQHVTFDCFNDGDKGTFKLFLYPEGDVLGRINYLGEQKLKQEYFKGNYKKLANSSIVIWGMWSIDPDFKERYFVLIELK